MILLDEPFTGVDVKTEAKIISLLREVTRGRQNDASQRTISDPSRHFAIIRSWSKAPSWQRADRHHFTAENLELALAAYCAMSHLTARKKALLLTMNALCGSSTVSGAEEER